jgi:hypothetical protein
MANVRGGGGGPSIFFCRPLAPTPSPSWPCGMWLSAEWTGYVYLQPVSLASQREATGMGHLNLGTISATSWSSVGIECAVGHS